MGSSSITTRSQSVPPRSRTDESQHVSRVHRAQHVGLGLEGGLPPALCRWQPLAHGLSVNSHVNMQHPGSNDSSDPKVGGNFVPGVRERMRALAFLGRVPLRAEIEVTRHCNLSCRHCYLPPVEGGRHEASGADYDRLFADLREAGCMSVILTGGEVLLRDDFFALASGVKRREMALSIITNGSLWTDGDAATLAELRPSSVTVSVYAADPGLHDVITGVPGSFERTCAGVRALSGAGLRCHLTSVLMPDTVAEFSALRSLASELGCGVSFDPTVAPRCDGSLDVLEYRVPASRLLDFYRDEFTFSHSREGSAVEGTRPFSGLKNNCGAGFTAVFVDAFGDVYPCMGFPPAFGNIREGFPSVWHGEAAEMHRQCMTEPLRACQGCELAPLCTTRCPRLALVEDGSVSAASSRACEMAGMVVQLRHHVAETRSSGQMLTSTVG